MKHEDGQEQFTLVRRMDGKIRVEVFLFELQSSQERMVSKHKKHEVG